MSQIVLDLTEENIASEAGEPTREELIQSIRLLKQMLRERLTQEYLTFRHQAEILGVPLETLGGSTGGGEHAPVFVHPHNPSLVWNGRGRRPRWVKEFFPSSGDTEPNENQDKLRAASDVTAAASSEATGTSSPVSAPADEPVGNGSETVSVPAFTPETHSEADPVPPSGTTPPDVSVNDVSVKAETASPAETSPSESPAESRTPSAAATAEEPPRRSNNRRTTSRPAAPEETNNPPS